MNEKLTQYLNGVFAPYDGVKSAADLKADLLSDLQERFLELKAQGKTDEEAFELTIDSIGDIEQTVQEVANLSRSLERQVASNFSASSLPGSDFAGVVAHKGKFTASALRGSDFSGADLTGSSFKNSDVRETNFNGANLTDCNLSVLDLTAASFNKSILVRTNFRMSGLKGTKFTGIRLTDVNFSFTDLKETVFEDCVFDGVDFNHSDLRGLCLDGLTFLGAKFDEASLVGTTFRGATLKDVSFHWTKIKSKTATAVAEADRFTGTRMDKLTYAALKGLGADLSKVSII